MSPAPRAVVSAHPILALAMGTAAATGLCAVVGSLLLDVPLRDPDGFLGPSWVRMPLLLVACMVVDVVPRILHGLVRGPAAVGPLALRVLRERWHLGRLVPITLAVASFYVTYVGYRNLKNFLPFVFKDSYDFGLVELDRTMAFGHDPANVLHVLLGTGTAAHVLSAVYMSYLIFVPISVAGALIFSRQLSHGLWYVTALCLNWSLGVVSYYLLPASGPFHVLPYDFGDLPSTDTGSLQDSLVRNRAQVLLQPDLTTEVSGVAAFASLHTSVVFTAALVLHLTRAPRLLRHVVWGYFVLTVTSTIYFGWHYLVDDIGGMAIGGIAVWAGARATRGMRRQHGEHEVDLVLAAERESVAAR